MNTNKMNTYTIIHLNKEKDKHVKSIEAIDYYLKTPMNTGEMNTQTIRQLNKEKDKHVKFIEAINYILKTEYLHLSKIIGTPISKKNAGKESYIAYRKWLIDHGFKNISAEAYISTAVKFSLNGKSGQEVSELIDVQKMLRTTVASTNLEYSIYSNELSGIKKYMEYLASMK